MHQINREADETDGVLRLSVDTKATVKVGPFSRGGKNRQGVEGVDHDFEPEKTLTPFGIFLPAHDEMFLYFAESRVTADFIVDALEDLWPTLEERFEPHKLVINADDGTENNSRRTQFIKRLVEFASIQEVTIQLAHYPPYHSKYNPIERVWGVLENHWNGELLDTVDAALGFAKTMTWNGERPVVQLVEDTYETGVSSTREAMKLYESIIERLPGLEKWFVTIPPCPRLAQRVMG